MREIEITRGGFTVFARVLDETQAPAHGWGLNPRPKTAV